MSSNLIGMKIIIRGNEFIDRDLSASIVMIDEDKNSMLLKLEEPIKNKTTTYHHIVASPRLSKDAIDSISTTGTLGCSVTWVPEVKYDAQNPMDLGWWRGGAATITDLYIS